MDPLPDGVTAAPRGPRKARFQYGRPPTHRDKARREWHRSPRRPKKEDDPSFRRYAVAALAEFDTTTADVWVTVTAPNKK